MILYTNTLSAIYTHSNEYTNNDYTFTKLIQCVLDNSYVTIK